MATNVHLFLLDSAVATAEYGKTNDVTRTYLPFNVITDIRDLREIPLTDPQVVEPNTAMGFITDQTLFFQNNDFRKNMFSLTEYLFYKAATMTAEEIEAALSITDPEDPGFVTALTYVPLSLSIPETVQINSDHFIPNLETTLPKYVSITLNVLDEDVTFQIWFDNEYMVRNFTDTTIDVIIPPLDYATLYSQYAMQSSKSDLANAAYTAEFVANRIRESVQDRDHTGIYTIKLKYYSSSENYLEIPFSVLYFGHRPGTLTIYAKIKEELLNSGVGDEDGWRNRIPSLFVSGSFFIVPLWDNEKTVGTRTFYPSHLMSELSKEKVHKTLYDIPGMDAYLTIMTTAYDFLSVAALPNPANEDNRFSIAEEHPTYQDAKTTDPTFRYMTADTQRFATRLIGSLAVAAGVETNTFYDRLEMDDRIFYSFVAGDIAYYVLDKESYLNLVA